MPGLAVDRRGAGEGPEEHGPDLRRENFLTAIKFCFEGFAPRKKSARQTWLASLADEQRTCVFFESPRRLAACLRDAVEQLGGARRAVVCRELTKVHEEVVRGSLDE